MTGNSGVAKLVPEGRNQQVTGGDEAVGCGHCGRVRRARLPAITALGFLVGHLGMYPSSARMTRVLGSNRRTPAGTSWAVRGCPLSACIGMCGADGLGHGAEWQGACCGRIALAAGLRVLEDVEMQVYSRTLPGVAQLGHTGVVAAHHLQDDITARSRILGVEDRAENEAGIHSGLERSGWFLAITHKSNSARVLLLM